jgi:hypothetical protein
MLQLQAAMHCFLYSTTMELIRTPLEEQRARRALLLELP